MHTAITSRTDPTAGRLAIGAEPRSEGGVHFRVWAPSHSHVDVIIEPADGTSRVAALSREPTGHHSATIDDARVGDRYRYRLGASGRAYPDPASRFQPEGPHGPSEIIDPASYAWRVRDWRGVPRERAVVYEMHIGTLTREGTWESASRELDALAHMGITVLELMPVADFPGRFGWGYDGVNMFAPTRLYGRPDEMRGFVDRAHELGMAVILDVVYNHLGPDGNYLRAFSERYFSTTHHTEWGEALNFDGDGCGPVREMILANARYWIDEFRLDGLRLDATQSIHDDSPVHILAEIAQATREAAGIRTILLIAENEPQDVRILRSVAEGGYGLDAAWNDDFHHAARVALTGRDEAYYLDYGGTAQELVSAARHSYLFQGQRYVWQKKRRGTSTRGMPPSRFVHFLQNHDQVANSADGRRLHHLTSPGRLRALTALLLLGPQIPMLFQGQEFAASSPFLYFADHHPELAERVRAGRREFLSQFPSIAEPEVAAALARPEDAATFMRSKLDLRERESNAAVVALHRDLLDIRRDDGAIGAASAGTIDGAVLSDSALVLRYPGATPADDRLLVINLGAALHLHRAPEPLLAPPAGRAWAVLWSSESPRYGGSGTGPLESEDDNWRLPAEAAVLLAPGDDAATD